MPEGWRSARRGGGTAAAAALAIAAAATAWAGIPPDQVSLEVPVYRLDDVPVIEERWSYSMGWGGIPVGSVTVSGSDAANAGGADGAAEERMRGQAVAVTGSTNGFVDLFWRYRLNARGEIRVAPFAPGHFHVDENEKRKEKTTRIDFDEQRHVKLLRHREGDTPNEYEFDAANTYDVLSTTWLFLNLDYEVGRLYEADTVTGTARYHVKITAEAEETIEVCDEPVEVYRLLGRTEQITDPDKKKKVTETYIWISKDRPRRLLKAQSKTTWGAITLALTEVTDLRSDPPELREAAAPVVKPTLCAAEERDRPRLQRRVGPRRFR